MLASTLVAILFIIVSSCAAFIASAASGLWTLPLVLLFLVLSGSQLTCLFFSGNWIPDLALASLNIHSLTIMGKKWILIIGLLTTIIVMIIAGVRSYLRRYLGSFLNLKLIAICALLLCILSGAGLIVNSYRAFKGAYKLIHFEAMEVPQSYASKILRKELFNNKYQCGKLSHKNLVLIFVEGFSSNVLDSENHLNLGLTKHLDSFKNKSIYFEDYFNVTAATFRGIAAQLTSSYQLGEGSIYASYAYKTGYYKTMRAQSLAKILSQSGYITSFVDGSGGGENFYPMLEYLGFKNIVGIQKHPEPLTDQQTFDYLKQTVQQYSHSASPYFIATYSEGTHAWFDSPNLKYRDGKNIYYNRFYNMDSALGDFIEWFTHSPNSKDTILVITGDHSAYTDKGFQESFHASLTPFIDRIPLWIWYHGVVPQNIKAGGRNNLDLAPTILQMLDQNVTSSWMLGCSLFDSQCHEKWQYLSTMSMMIFSTKTGKAIRVRDPEIKKEISLLYSLEGNGIISN